MRQPSRAIISVGLRRSAMYAQSATLAGHLVTRSDFERRKNVLGGDAVGACPKQASSHALSSFTNLKYHRLQSWCPPSRHGKRFAATEHRRVHTLDVLRKRFPVQRQGAVYKYRKQKRVSLLCVVMSTIF